VINLLELNLVITTGDGKGKLETYNFLPQCAVVEEISALNPEPGDFRPKP